MRPRVFCLLSWYDESPTWLAAMVASVAPFTHHIVCLDGAYSLFPGGEPRSPAEQHVAIMEAALGAGIGCTIHAPNDLWWGNEVEKRNALFQFGLLAAEPRRDWFLVMDADEVVTQWPVDLLARLERVEEDACTITQWEQSDPAGTEVMEEFYSRACCSPRGQYHHRKLFRAVPGLGVFENHFRYQVRDADGNLEKRLWGEEGPKWPPLAPAADMTQLRVRHRIIRRSLWRGEQQRGYYQARDTMGVEQTERPDVVEA